MEPKTVAKNNCWTMLSQSVSRRSIAGCANAMAMLKSATHVPYESCGSTSESV